MVGRDIIRDCVNGHRYKVHEEDVKDGIVCPECGGYSWDTGYASKMWRTGETLPVYKNNKQKSIQDKAKEHVKKLLLDYDVIYIDYSATDDDYTIKLEKLDNQK